MPAMQNELNPWLNASANQCTKASSESCCVDRLYVVKSDWFNFHIFLLFFSYLSVFVVCSSLTFWHLQYPLHEAVVLLLCFLLVRIVCLSACGMCVSSGFFWFFLVISFVLSTCL